MHQRPRTTGSLRDVTDLFLTDQWRANRNWLTNGNLPARVGKGTSSIKVKPYHYILHHVIIYIIIPYHCIIIILYHGIILYHAIACMLYHVIIIIYTIPCHYILHHAITYTHTLNTPPPLPTYIIQFYIMQSTRVQTLGGTIGTFGLETPLHAYVLGIYRTSFQHNLHCFIDACVHVVNDYNYI